MAMAARAHKSRSNGKMLIKKFRLNDQPRLKNPLAQNGWQLAQRALQRTGIAVLERLFCAMRQMNAASRVAYVNCAVISLGNNSEMGQTGENHFEHSV